MITWISKYWRLICGAIFIVLLIVGANTSANAENVFDATTNFTYDVFTFGKASIAERLVDTPSANTIIFFGGAGERGSAVETIELLKNKDVLFNWNIIGVAIKNDDGASVNAWSRVVDDAIEYIITKINSRNIIPEKIYVEGLSNGGYGAYLMALRLNGIKTIEGTVEVQEVTFIDGVLSNKINEAQINELLKRDILVRVYVAKRSDYNVSKNGKRLVKIFDGTPGFEGILLDWGHTTSIIKLIYENGLHQEYE